jgi:hypothetical protein
VVGVMLMRQGPLRLLHCFNHDHPFQACSPTRRGYSTMLCFPCGIASDILPFSLILIPAPSANPILQLSTCVRADASLSHGLGAVARLDRPHRHRPRHRQRVHRPQRLQPGFQPVHVSVRPQAPRGLMGSFSSFAGLPSGSCASETIHPLPCGRVCQTHRFQRASLTHVLAYLPQPAPCANCVGETPASRAWLSYISDLCQPQRLLRHPGRDRASGADEGDRRHRQIRRHGPHITGRQGARWTVQDAWVCPLRDRCPRHCRSACVLACVPLVWPSSGFPIRLLLLLSAAFRGSQA